MVKTEKKRVRFVDTTLRDAHQSLWATRMRTKDILGILEAVDDAGFYAIECWGGATFDVCMRFLREDPWERLRQIKAVCKKTPLQMLLRGQNCLGYKHYPDDVLERCVAKMCENGMDIFRCFDALNDVRNLEAAIKAVKKYGGHAQGTICYTVSPVHTAANFVKFAKEQVDLGIDSLAIKDMAGILTPAAARELVGALKKALPDLPIEVHSHMTSGMAPAMYMAAVEAGAGAIDCAVATLSGFSSQPAHGTMKAIFEGLGYETGVKVDRITEIDDYFKKLKPQRALQANANAEVVDVQVLIHHIPGGMISNTRSQLAQQGALDKLPEVLEELPRVRKDMGYPPLVTPTSQIMGVQAVLNVLTGKRYETVTNETRQYVAGYYGRSPAPVDRLGQGRQGARPQAGEERGRHPLLLHVPGRGAGLLQVARQTRRRTRPHPRRWRTHHRQGRRAGQEGRGSAQTRAALRGRRQVRCHRQAVRGPLRVARWQHQGRCLRPGRDVRADG